MSDEPKITIVKTYTADGWTTVVTMPDGTEYRQVVTRVSCGSFRTEGDDFWDDEDCDVPDCVAEIANATVDMDVSQWLSI